MCYQLFGKERGAVLFPLGLPGAWGPGCPGLMSQEPGGPGVGRALGGQHLGPAGRSGGAPGPVLTRVIGYEGGRSAGPLRARGPLSRGENLVTSLLSRERMCLEREGEVGVGRV